VSNAPGSYNVTKAFGCTASRAGCSDLHTYRRAWPGNGRWLRISTRPYGNSPGLTNLLRPYSSACRTRSGICLKRSLRTGHDCGGAQHL